MTEVRLDNVVREVDGTRILDSVSFTAADGELLGLIGPSGAGKTSVIRAIAGFDPVTSGSIRFDGDDMAAIPTSERDIGIVTQDSTFFPSTRVRGNLSFPLFARGTKQSEIRKRVEIESRAHNIDHILDRWPNTLSGGELQLSQIARALIRRPRVFLMDEPLANLDPPTKRRLRQELVAIQKGYGVTTLYVANRPEEIMTVPDRLIAIEHGRVVQTGTPNEIYADPATLTIAQLTGGMGTLTGTLVHDGNGLVLTAAGMALRLGQAVHQRHVGDQITLGVRSGDVRLSPSGPLSMTAGRLTFDQSATVRLLTSPAGTIATTDSDLDEGHVVTVWLDRFHLFAESGHRVS